MEVLTNKESIEGGFVIRKPFQSKDLLAKVEDAQGYSEYD